MSEINFDDIEENYNKAILRNTNNDKKKNSKNKKEKQTKEKFVKEKVLKDKTIKDKTVKKIKNESKKYNEHKIVFFSLILSVFLIFLFLNLITQKNEPEKINKNLVDEVKFIEEDFTEELLNTKNENKNEIESKKVDANENKVEIVKKQVELVSEKEKVVETKTEFEKYYAIQVGASKNLELAESKIKELLKTGEKAYYVKEGINKYMYKIIIDKKFKTREIADEYAEKLKNNGIITKDFWVRYFNK